MNKRLLGDKTGTCPLCDTSTVLKYSMHGVLVCLECLTNYRRLLALSNNGDREAYGWVKKVSKRIEEVKPKPKTDAAFFYAKYNWKF